MSASFTKVIKPRQADGSLYACPCCGHHTLETRGEGEVCRVCIWQDNGQDDPFADEVWGGSNGKLSLAEARKNYRECGAYDPRIGRDQAARAKVPELPTAPPPPAPPRTPPPPPWWTRLSKRQQVTLLAEIGAVLLLGLCAYWFASGWLSGHMLKDRGYYLWAHGKGHYQQEYLATFARDPAFQRRFLGQPLDSLHPFFPSLFGGGYYDPDALRAINPGHSFPSYKGTPIQVYRLDSRQWGLTYCVLVVDGQIKDFFFVNR